jgi:hypothetical protein
MSSRLLTDEQLREAANKGFSNSACNGATLYDAITYLFRYGVSNNSCVNDQSYVNACKKERHKNCIEISKDPSATQLPTCEELIGRNYDTCPGSKEALRYYRAVGVCNIKAGYDLIRQEIYRWGPVATGFNVYEDFLKFDGKSIYKPKPGQVQLGGHAVSIVGWGTEAGQNYWIMANSWGNKWGNKGYFKIVANDALLQIENNTVGLFPDLPYSNIGSVSPLADYQWLQDAQDDKYRRGWLVNLTTGYLASTTAKIQSGELKGSLEPTIERDDVPNYENFVAGEKRKGLGIFKFSSTSNSNYFIWLIFIIVIIAVIWFVWKKK